jgi:hypothetical protein
MDRREFLKSPVVAGAYAVLGTPWAAAGQGQEPWFERPMRWAQLVLVENDPGRFDPDFWLDYFKRIHADGACLSAGGIVAYYPTKVPLHHRSAWLGDSDPFGYLVQGCRKMGMAVIARTDPHATWDNVHEAHPDWIAVDAQGQKRRHWANPELWVTCALGPYNFEFMTGVHKEIIQAYQVDGIFANRWNSQGMCYCEHCASNFKTFSGMDLPRTTNRQNAAYRKYLDWQTARMKELWLLWDRTIREVRPASRFLPNGFPDNVVTGALSDILVTDHQGRSGVIPPWSNGKRAKELRATMGMKPLRGMFSVGLEEKYRWKDSVQSDHERGPRPASAQRDRMGGRRRDARASERSRHSRCHPLAAEAVSDGSSGQPDQPHDDEGPLPRAHPYRRAKGSGPLAARRESETNPLARWRQDLGL